MESSQHVPSLGHILVADDQADVIQALEVLLRGAGAKVDGARTPAAALECVENNDYDVAIIDLNYTIDTTSGQEGIELLRRLHEADASLPIIAMTAWGSIAGAVEAMKYGARDYIEKPWNNTRLLSQVRVSTELGRALRKGRRLQLETARQRAASLPHVIAESAAMKDLLELIHRVAPSEASVLITGDHGVGKEVIARFIHAASTRSAEPLVVVNAGGLADGVLESELFGHVKGAFTDAKTDRPGCFELADGGTLFLDEIGNMPLTQQSKLLRVLQMGDFRPVGASRVKHVDVRVIAATNAQLQEQVRARAFREDLLYRLNTISLRVPSLRERQEDILPLAQTFLAHHNRRHPTREKQLSATACAALQRHTWPGNVRELQHTIERAFLLSTTSSLTEADIRLEPQFAAISPSIEQMTLAEAEKWLVERAVERFGGNVNLAAAELGLSRSALYRRLSRPTRDDE